MINNKTANWIIITGVLVISFLLYKTLALAILGVAGVAFFYWLAQKNYAVAVVLYVALFEGFFSILPIGGAQRLLSDINVLLVVAALLIYILSLNWLSEIRFRGYIILGFLYVFSVWFSQLVGAWGTFDQPLSIGIMVARKYILLATLIILIMVKPTQCDIKKSLDYLAYTGLLLAVMSIIDSALGGGVIFKNYFDIGQERAGIVRLHVGSLLIVYSLFYFIFQAASGRILPAQSKLISVTFLIVICYYLGFVNLTRSIYIGIAITIVILWVLVHKQFRGQFIALTGFGFIFASIVFLISDTGREIINQTIMEMTSSQGNISIRDYASHYFIDLASSAGMFFGVGVFSDVSYPGNPVTMAGDYYNYFLIDVNFISIFVQFGLAGSIISILYYGLLVRDTVVATRKGPVSNQIHIQTIAASVVFMAATPYIYGVMVERCLVYIALYSYYVVRLNESESS